ncbi:ABC transporter permease [Roseibium sp. SCP14]|uniref:ABC transporter permease n=1 Tax=Roseibium sp. SCP14 TaxID=3141375 RepID=UPI00333D8A84
MKPDRKDAGLRAALLSYPTALLVFAFVIPMGIMFVSSFYHRTETYYERGFELTHYLRTFDWLYIKAMWTTVKLSTIAATIAVLLAFPFTYFMSGYSRRVQTVILVVVLGVLSLSEVIVAFSWSNALSRPAGISNFFVWLGFMERPASWARGLPAVLIALSYFNLSIAILMLYPHCTRLDPSYVEAARTMGTSPARSMFKVVIPILRKPLIATWIVLFVFTMGAVVTPQWLGRPDQWMLAVHISKQAVELGNIPFASALSIVFLLVTIAMVLVANRFADKS